MHKSSISTITFLWRLDGCDIHYNYYEMLDGFGVNIAASASPFHLYLKT
jgi:hypothetical protein